jgi:hypothetical protein
MTLPKKPGHPTISAFIYYLDGSTASKRKRKIFRAYSNPDYGVISDGREVQNLQVGVGNKKKWYLKGTGKD